MTTKPHEWKHTVEIMLPNSGYTVEIRPLGLDLVLKCDHVPDVMTSLVLKAFKGEVVDFNVNEYKHAREFAEFLDLCCELCFVHPQVVERPEGEDQISADMIEFEDKMFIFGFLGKSRRWLEFFSDEQKQSLQSGAEGGGVSPDAEPTAEAEEAPAT